MKRSGHRLYIETLRKAQAAGERDYLTRLMRYARSFATAVEASGVNRSTLWRLLRKHGWRAQPRSLAWKNPTGRHDQ